MSVNKDDKRTLECRVSSQFKQAASEFSALFSWCSYFLTCYFSASVLPLGKKKRKSVLFNLTLTTTTFFDNGTHHDAGFTSKDDYNLHRTVHCAHYLDFQFPSYKYNIEISKVLMNE